MGKKVLVISASPRPGGNSDLLCDQFILGAREAGHTVEKIFLGNKLLNFCRGCYACLRKGREGKCVHPDDMPEILDKMIQTDVLVFATPVYFYSMNAQMKVLIDRTLPKYTQIKNKKAYLIATAGEDDESAVEGAITGYRNFLACLTDVQDAGHVYGTGVNYVNDILGHPAMEKAYKMGESI